MANIETKDMKTASQRVVVAEKDGKQVKMTEAHFKAIEKSGWKKVGETEKPSDKPA